MSAAPLRVALAAAWPADPLTRAAFDAAVVYVLDPAARDAVHDWQPDADPLHALSVGAWPDPVSWIEYPATGDRGILVHAGVLVYRQPWGASVWMAGAARPGHTPPVILIGPGEVRASRLDLPPGCPDRYAGMIASAAGTAARWALMIEAGTLSARIDPDGGTVSLTPTPARPRAHRW